MGRSLQPYIPMNSDASIVVSASGRLCSTATNGFFTQVIVSQYCKVTSSRTATVFLGTSANNNYFKLKGDTVTINFATSTITVKDATATVPVSILAMW